MTVHGVGSVNSPIVISDDEDEVCVELQLEQRLSSPREGMELDFDFDSPVAYSWRESHIHHHSLYRDELHSDNYSFSATPNSRPMYGTPFGVSSLAK